MSEPAPLLAPLKPAVQAPRLWNGTAFVDDPWLHLADGEPFPIGGQAIVSLARWRAEEAALTETGAAVGVIVQPGESLDTATDNVARLAVVALAFPKFTDGRAYSAARRLREAGFGGQIRATGDVLLDQLPLMLRAGFDAFEITHAATARALEQAPVPAVSRIYQRGAPTSIANWRSRRAARATESCRSS